MPRVLRRLAGIVLALATLYLVAGNLFLNTPLGPWAINRKPERFHMTWSWGLTAWPGQVMLWNIETKGHVRHVMWSAQARRAHGRIAVLPLFSRELRLPSVDADEVSATVVRVDQEMLPPPAREGGWRLRFDRLATGSARHLRLGAFDIAMHGSATFAFTKQLRGGPLEVLPSNAALDEMRITLGDDILLRDGKLDGSFALARHRREDAAGLAKLGLADAGLHLSGHTPGLSVDLDIHRGWQGAIVADAEGGRLEAKLALEHGVLKPGGLVDLRLPLRATRDGARFSDMAMLRVSVIDAGLEVDLRLPPPPGDEGEVRGRFSVAGARLPDLLAGRDLLAKTSGTLDVDWHFASLDWLTPLLVKAPWLTLEGAGRVEAALKVAHGRFQPGSRASVPEVDLVATVAGHRFSGRARAEAALADAEGGQRASVALELAQYAIAAADAPERRLVQGRGLRIDLDAAGELEGFRDSAKARLRFADAEVPDLRPLNAWVPGDSIELLGGGARIGSDLELDAEGLVTRGRVTLGARAMRARFGTTTLAGGFDLDARLGGSDLKARHFDLGGSTLKLQNLRLSDDEPASPRRWWATVSVPRGRIEANPPARVDAEARIEMQDIGLLLALYARHRDYPRWVAGLLDAGRVDARGRLRVAGSTLFLDDVEASNDRFDVKARLRMDRRTPQGDLLLGWRALALGLELKDGARSFHLLRARDWYAQQPARIPAR